MKKRLPERSCGPCTVCCVVNVVEEMDKPFGEHCAALDEVNGCAMYDDRPETCSGYYCLWLMEGSNEALARLPRRARRAAKRQLRGAERPDLVGVLVDYAVSAAGLPVLVAKEVRPGAFEEPEAAAILERLSGTQSVLRYGYRRTPKF